MKTKKIIYWISTGLLSAMLLMSAGMYLFKTDDISALFTSFGYPTYLIFPLAFAKIAAVAALWIPKLDKLKQWAYSALFFEFILAFFAHYMVGDGEQMGAVLALVLLLTSFFMQGKLSETKTK